MRVRKTPRLGGARTWAASSLLAVLIVSVGIHSEKPAAGATTGPTLSVDAASGLHAISPLIYGWNDYQADETLAAKLRIPIQRLGGDATTRYNWEQDSSNAGGDWYFMSGGNSNPVPSGGPDALVTQDKSMGSGTILTIPIIPWINNSASTNCSFPTSVYGAQESVNPYVTLSDGSQCGDGLTTSAQPITDTDIGANNTANTPSFEAQWVQHLVTKFGTAAEGGVPIFEMDNEPSGWDNTHRDVHPANTGWDELVGLTERYAAAVKSVDPTAAIDGPGDFGWAAYVDAGPPGDDQASHGGSIWEAQYYLQQLAAYQANHGVRLLDYFDEHYYPTTPSGVSCIALCEEGDAATQAARLQATRSLWDPTYVENDWIGQYFGDIDLIPRMKSWINQYYPGTKTAISEYNFGALDSMNGALAQADALGIFGAQGLDLATLWGPPTTGQPGAFAFAMYRNYDGQGDGFGNTSVSATSSDQNNLAIYGATRSSDGDLTLMVLNKTADDLTSPLRISGFSPGTQASDYNYGPSDLSAISHGPNVAINNGTITTTYPANSITLLVITPATKPSTTTGTPGAPVPNSQGFSEVAADGGLFNFGNAGFFGSMGSQHLNQPIVAMARTPDGRGYWEVASDGGVFAFGDAKFLGSMGGSHINKPIVAVATTADGMGYWEVASDGGVFAFGDAKFLGSMGGSLLNKPIVAVAPTADSMGYWEVASDGGVFAFGDAKFLGSMGSQHLNQPIVAVARTPDGNGYWEVASDGGVFAFGDAKFFGSMGGSHLNKPIVAIVPTPDGNGYWEVASDGGVFAFGDAKFLGSMGGSHLNKPIVGAA